MENINYDVGNEAYYIMGNVGNSLHMEIDANNISENAYKEVQNVVNTAITGRIMGNIQDSINENMDYAKYRF